MNDRDAALMARHIEEDPYHPGPGDVRLVDSGVSVWAVIGHLPSVGGNLAQAASDYDLSPEEMDAVVAYYRTHGPAIDARLAANAGGRPVEPVAV
jgi:uncharacterized protein (DUF433 family)